MPFGKQLGPALGTAAEGLEGRLLSRGPAKVGGHLVGRKGFHQGDALGGEAKGVGASLGALLLAPRFGRQEKSERLPQGRVIVLRQPAAKGQLGGVQEWRRV